MAGFRAEVLKGIKERASRIISAYITKEANPRALFSSPEKYNISIRDIKAEGAELKINILAMFAFRCKYLSTADNTCAIHPAVLTTADIRPEHCGYMGRLDAKPNEKGYCRIIHSAAKQALDSAAIDASITIEKGAGQKFYDEGVNTPEEAADKIIKTVRNYCETSLPSAMPVKSDKTTGRNDPCSCGSGIKYKKCHGR